MTNSSLTSASAKPPVAGSLRSSVAGSVTSERPSAVRVQTAPLSDRTSGDTIHCTDGALRIATRICSAYPDHHRVIAFSGLTKKNQVGLTAYETAIALAMMDEGRCLVVDAYPGRPFLGDLIRLSGKAKGKGKFGPEGLAQILSGTATVDDVLLTGSVANLDLLTAGGTVEPAWFLTERCNVLLKDLRERYAFVIIATAPVIDSPECMRLATHCDALAAVVTPGKHSQKELRQLTSDLSTLSIPLLGVIFSS